MVSVYTDSCAKQLDVRESEEGPQAQGAGMKTYFPITNSPAHSAKAVSLGDTDVPGDEPKPASSALAWDPSSLGDAPFSPATQQCKSTTLVQVP